MKLLHIADLHIGKRVNGALMIEDQMHVVNQILSIAQQEQVSAVLIAGDIFDRPFASRDALDVCEHLFSSLCALGIKVFAIPGNHDSAQQLSFCSGLLTGSGLFIAKSFSGEVLSEVITDGSEQVCIHLLPFVRPTDVRMALPGLADSIHSHDDAIRAALSVDTLEESMPNILVAHQFVTAGGNDPETCDSEIVNVGGADNVDYTAFDAYDYVALGHLHGAQHVGRPQVRYSGSPLKYSFSEVNQKKSATLLTIEDGNVLIDTRELLPLHDMREITASYDALAHGKDTGNHLDYMRVTLTDKSLYDAMAKLRLIYPNILRLDWEYLSIDKSFSPKTINAESSSSPLELFEEFYLAQTGEVLNSDDEAIVNAALEEAQNEAS